MPVNQLVLNLHECRELRIMKEVCKIFMRRFDPARASKPFNNLDSITSDIEAFGILNARGEAVKMAWDAIHSGDPVCVQNLAFPAR